MLLICRWLPWTSKRIDLVDGTDENVFFGGKVILEWNRESVIFGLVSTVSKILTENPHGLENLKLQIRRDLLFSGFRAT